MGTPTERDIEREKIEWVFALAGGELDDDPVIYERWLVDATAPRWTTPDDHPQYQLTFRYTYDGPPDYAEEFTHDYDHEYFTAVECLLHGGADERIKIGDVEYELVATFTTSGETACPSEPDDCWPDGKKRCPLCEADHGKDHGYIYIGDGWAEIVYRKVATGGES